MCVCTWVTSAMHTAHPRTQEEVLFISQRACTVGGGCDHSEVLATQPRRWDEQLNSLGEHISFAMETRIQPYDRRKDANGAVLAEVAAIEKHAFPKHEALTGDLHLEVAKRNMVLLLAHGPDGSSAVRVSCSRRGTLSRSPSIGSAELRQMSTPYWHAWHPCQTAVPLPTMAGKVVLRAEVHRLQRC